MSEKIIKMSHQDIYTQLSSKLDGYGYVTDYDLEKSEVYVTKWSAEGRELYSFNFSIKDNVVSVDLESEKHKVAVTTYQDIPDEEPVTMSKLKSFIKSLLGTPTTNTLVPVVKQFDEEQMIAIERLYLVPEHYDAHGHTISEEDTELMVKSFNSALSAGTLKFSLFHTHETNTFKTLRAWVNPYDCTIGDQFVPKGQPMCENQFLNKAAWEDRKINGLAGVSVGCKATLVDVED
jgi:hypothetical protein